MNNFNGQSVPYSLRRAQWILLTIYWQSNSYQNNIGENRIDREQSPGPKALHTLLTKVSRTGGILAFSLMMFAEVKFGGCGGMVGVSFSCYELLNYITCQFVRSQMSQKKE